MQSAFVTLDPGQAVVVFNPVLVKAEELAQAVIAKTPFGAEVRSVKDYSEAKKSNAGRQKNCLILGFFCSDPNKE